MTTNKPQNGRDRMTHKVCYISQTGNVAKSTQCYGMAVEALNNGLKVKVVDLDREHRTISEFSEMRDEMGLEPSLDVYSAENAQDALRAGEGEGLNLILIDCPSRASAATVAVAEGCDLVVQPTTTGKKDLDLALNTFAQLLKKGVPKSKLLFVLTRVGSASEMRKAIEYIKSAEAEPETEDEVPVKYDFEVLSSALWEKLAYRSSMNDGFSIVETPYVTLNDAAKSVIHQTLTFCMRNV